MVCSFGFTLHHEQTIKRPGTRTASMIAMIEGLLCNAYFFFVGLQDREGAPRFCFNRSVVLASLIEAFDFVSPFALTQRMDSLLKSF